MEKESQKSVFFSADDLPTARSMILYKNVMTMIGTVLIPLLFVKFNRGARDHLKRTVFPLNWFCLENRVHPPSFEITSTPDQ